MIEKRVDPVTELVKAVLLKWLACQVRLKCSVGLYAATFPLVFSCCDVGAFVSRHVPRANGGHAVGHDFASRPPEYLCAASSKSMGSGSSFSIVEQM